MLCCKGCDQSFRGALGRGHERDMENASPLAGYKMSEPRRRPGHTVRRETCAARFHPFRARRRRQLDLIRPSGRWRRRAMDSPASSPSVARERVLNAFAGAGVAQGNAHRVSNASAGYLACIPRARRFSRETPAIARIGRRAKRIKASRRCGVGAAGPARQLLSIRTECPGPVVPGRLLIRRVRARLRLLFWAPLRAVVV